MLVEKIVPSEFSGLGVSVSIRNLCRLEVVTAENKIAAFETETCSGDASDELICD